ncbi:MAG TPA: ElyC/SanA/YdcF family protein [Anaerolineales bacterium]|nr:ElyC/SanA/YdcF family protein [Anaerolineales bacterium]
MKIFKRVLLAAPFVGLALILGPRAFTELYSLNRIYQVEDAPSRKIAIVLGAGLWRDGRPTPVLRDRVDSAAQLFFDGKVEKLLMSGDNRFENYNEPGAMRAYALSLGVPDEAIVLDFAGRRTYDTCYRARHIFGVQEAIVVTQRFHLPRAVYTCSQLGVSAVGVDADRRQYRRFSLAYWNMREIAATAVALYEVHVARPLPVLGSPEPIFAPNMINQ